MDGKKTYIACLLAIFVLGAERSFGLDISTIITTALCFAFLVAMTFRDTMRKVETKLSDNNSELVKTQEEIKKSSEKEILLTSKGDMSRFI